MRIRTKQTLKNADTILGRLEALEAKNAVLEAENKEFKAKLSTLETASENIKSDLQNIKIGKVQA